MAVVEVNISTPCKAYERMATLWDLPSTLMGGTVAMRAAGEKYLPMEPKESPEAYRIRLNRTVLFNAFGKAVKALTGKMLDEDIKVEEDVAPQLVPLLEDIDCMGHDLNQFAMNVELAAMQFGMSHVLVDVPPAQPGVLSKADEKAAGIRPYWVHVLPTNLIGWKYKQVNGKMKLTEVRIRECCTVADGEWGEKDVTRIRLLRPGTWAVYEKKIVDNKEVWAIAIGDDGRPMEGATTLDFIPLVTVYTNQTGFMEATPPLEDLARLNVAHWQSSSDQRHILHVARVPLLFGSGFEDSDAPIEIGVNRLIKGPSGSTLTYVEHTGAAIQAGGADLLQLEEKMAIMAMEPTLNQKSGTVTATGRAIDSAEAHCTLQTMSKSLEDALEQLLVVTGAWMKLAKEQCGGLQVCCDFSLSTQDAPELASLDKARDRGDISRPAYCTELKRRSVLHEDYDIDGDKELLDREVPAMGGVKDGMVVCPHCAAVVPEGDTICPECDATLKAQPEAPEKP